jgi:antitoxin HicB
MVNLNYPIHLQAAEDGSVTVTFPQVPEAITQGEDQEAALFAAVDALEAALSFYIDEGTDLPQAGRPKRGQRTVRPSALACIKLAIYQSMRDQGVKKSDLARRLGWHMPQVDRLLDLNHASQFRLRLGEARSTRRRKFLRALM